MKDKVRALAQRFGADVVAYRRHLHQYPELSFQEEQTAQFIAQRLQEWGVEHRAQVAGTGIVALVRGRRPHKRAVALRADMDALPIQENNEVPYRSQHPGVMHACGHDAHTAALLGAVRILQALRQYFSGTVTCLFQPGEERLPGGASLMIQAGALENPRPSALFGQHVYPALPAGMVGFRAGDYMASADEIYLLVKGRGGHAAMPHDCIDPIAISAQIVVALQQIAARYADPAVPTVLTFGRIASEGGATNVIPNAVRLEGTFRTMNEKWRAEAHRRIKKIAESVAKGMGGACEVTIVKGYPVLHNHVALTRRARRWAEDLLGKDRVVDLPVRMTAEDFAYYSQLFPSCFYRLGTGNSERGIIAPVHTDRFDIDEAALETGSALLAWLALCELEHRASS